MKTNHNKQFTKIPLKDMLFNAEKINKIANEINAQHKDFQTELFVKVVIDEFPNLELKERISWTAKCLKKYLPSEYQDAVFLLLKSLPSPNNPNLLDNDFGDFIYAVYSDFVAQYGCKKEYFDISLKALKQITMRFSAEDAMRYFINAFPQETFAELLIWSKDKNHHVRRLCSESTRPKLPWSQKINLKVDSPIAILDNLFFDQSRFVTRSVANHLNDISKIDPQLTLNVLQKWRDSNKQNEKEMDFIVHHALRTLIKKGNQNALKMLGVNVMTKLEICNFDAQKTIHLPSNLEFKFTVKAKQDGMIVIDYTLYFQDKLGRLKNKKTFKLKKCTIKNGDSLQITKKHLLKPKMTTRTMHKGAHELHVHINGNLMAKHEFEVRF